MGIRAAAATAILPGTAVVLVPLGLVAAGLGRFPRQLGVVEVFSLLLAGVAAGLYLACLRVFLSVGRGTPLPSDPPQRLVVVGPYRRVRNPMYLAALGALLAQSLAYRSTAVGMYGLILTVAFHRFVTGTEEPRLETTFGEAYRAYRRQVPRWFPRRAPAVFEPEPFDPGDPQESASA